MCGAREVCGQTHRSVGNELRCGCDVSERCEDTERVEGCGTSENSVGSYGIIFPLHLLNDPVSVPAEIGTICIKCHDVFKKTIFV